MTCVVILSLSKDRERSERRRAKPRRALPLTLAQLASTALGAALCSRGRSIPHDDVCVVILSLSKDRERSERRRATARRVTLALAQLASTALGAAPLQSRSFDSSR